MAYASAVELVVNDDSAITGKPVVKPMVAPTATHGNKFYNDGRTIFRVKNGSAAPITVTFNVPGTLYGLAVTSPAPTVAATGDGNGLDFQDFGPFPAIFNQSDGYVWAVCSAVATVTVGAFRVPGV